MKILLTVEQHAEITNPFWDIDYTATVDGEEVTANITDDEWHFIPDGVMVGEMPAVYDEDDNIVGYVMSHPRLTWEDDIMLSEVLNERAEFTAALKAAKKADRAGMRSDKRVELRQAARADTRREARRKARQSDRQQSRRLYRQELRRSQRVADRIAARQAELDVENGI